MTETGPIKVLINPLILDWIDEHCPEYMPRTAFINHLLQTALMDLSHPPEGLTRVPRLGGTATQRQDTSLRSALALEEINLPRNEPPRSAERLPVLITPDLQRGGAVPSNAREEKKIQYTDGFNTFWKLYQSAPKKASGQNKLTAFKQWQKALLHEEAQRIVDAIGNCIRDQQKRIQRDEFVSPLPDCHRWLRDHGFAVHLEEHEVAERPKADPEAEARNKEHGWIKLSAMAEGLSFEEMADQLRANGKVRYH